MVEKSVPLLKYTCSISPQTLDEGGNAKTFSIHAGNTGDFSSNVLKHMPISKTAGKYLMIFDPIEETLTIKKPE